MSTAEALAILAALGFGGYFLIKKTQGNGGGDGDGDGGGAPPPPSPPSPPPISLDVTVSARPLEGDMPLTVNFECNARGKSPYSYYWTFGDNSEPVVYQNPSHVYDAASTYVARCRVTDANGTENIGEVGIMVYDPSGNPPLPPPDLPPDLPPPEAPPPPLPEYSGPMPEFDGSTFYNFQFIHLRGTRWEAPAIAATSLNAAINALRSRGYTGELILTALQRLSRS